MHGATHLDLVDHVEGVCVSLVCKHHLHQRVCNSIRGISCSLKRVTEVCLWIWHGGMATEYDKSSDTDAVEELAFEL